MYAAYGYDAISDSGTIKHEDLPDVIFRGNVQFNKIDPVFLFETRYGVYLDPTSPNEENEGYIYWNTDGGDLGPVWSAFEEGGRNCLIDELNGFQKDDFADTYTAIGFLGVEIPVNRTGLCTWEGSITADGSTYTALIYYGGGLPFVGGDNLKWNLGVGVSGDIGIGSSVGIKADPQNSPIGTYTDPLSLEVFYVNP